MPNKKQLKQTALPRAEKLKKYIKDIFESEAKAEALAKVSLQV